MPGILMCAFDVGASFSKTTYLKTDAERSQVIDSGVWEQVLRKHTSVAQVHIFVYRHASLLVLFIGLRPRGWVMSWFNSF